MASKRKRGLSLGAAAPGSQPLLAESAVVNLDAIEASFKIKQLQQKLGYRSPGSPNGLMVSGSGSGDDEDYRPRKKIRAANGELPSAAQKQKKSAHLAGLQVPPSRAAQPRSKKKGRKRSRANKDSDDSQDSRPAKPNAPAPPNPYLPTIVAAKAKAKQTPSQAEPKSRTKKKKKTKKLAPILSSSSEAEEQATPKPKTSSQQRRSSRTPKHIVPLKPSTLSDSDSESSYASDQSQGPKGVVILPHLPLSDTSKTNANPSGAASTSRSQGKQLAGSHPQGIQTRSTAQPPPEKPAGPPTAPAVLGPAQPAAEVAPVVPSVPPAPVSAPAAPMEARPPNHFPLFSSPLPFYMQLRESLTTAEGRARFRKMMDTQAELARLTLVFYEQQEELLRAERAPPSARSELRLRGPEDSASQNQDATTQAPQAVVQTEQPLPVKTTSSIATQASAKHDDRGIQTPATNIQDSSVQTVPADEPTTGSRNRTPANQVPQNVLDSLRRLSQGPPSLSPVPLEPELSIPTILQASTENSILPPSIEMDIDKPEQPAQRNLLATEPAPGPVMSTPHAPQAESLPVSPPKPTKPTESVTESSSSEDDESSDDLTRKRPQKLPTLSQLREQQNASQSQASRASSVSKEDKLAAIFRTNQRRITADQLPSISSDLDEDEDEEPDDLRKMSPDGSESPAEHGRKHRHSQAHRRSESEEEPDLSDVEPPVEEEEEAPPKSRPSLTLKEIEASQKNGMLASKSEADGEDEADADPDEPSDAAEPDVTPEAEVAASINGAKPLLRKSSNIDVPIEALARTDDEVIEQTMKHVSSSSSDSGKEVESQLGATSIPSRPNSPQRPEATQALEKALSPVLEQTPLFRADSLSQASPQSTGAKTQTNGNGQAKAGGAATSEDGTSSDEEDDEQAAETTYMSQGFSIPARIFKQSNSRSNWSGAPSSQLTLAALTQRSRRRPPGLDEMRDSLNLLPTPKASAKRHAISRDGDVSDETESEDASQNTKDPRFASQARPSPSKRAPSVSQQSSQPIRSSQALQRKKAPSTASSGRITRQSVAARLGRN